jgi:flagellar biosynthetic protein FliR
VNREGHARALRVFGVRRMSIQDLPLIATTFVLAFFRIAAMMLFAPLFGSSRIPKRVRVLLALVLAWSIVPTVPQVALPDSTWGLATGIAGEMAFGLAMGMILSFVFIAAQWAGEIVGQQMGLNLSEVFDPQFGAQGSIIGEMYFMLTLVVFLAIGGHHEMLRGVRDSFDRFELLTLGITPDLFDTLIGLLLNATKLAFRLAAPMLVTMLVVDLALGLIGKMMPQMNVMAMGLSLRSALGLVIVILGLAVTNFALGEGVLDAMETVRVAWTTG